MHQAGIDGFTFQVTPFAILAFAGIRPAEVQRLTWDDIHLDQDNIRLGGRKTKTGKLSHPRTA